MAQPNRNNEQLTELERLNDALSSGTFMQVRRLLNGLPPSEAAHLLESSPPNVRAVLWQLVDSDNEGEILQYLGDDLKTQFLLEMDSHEVLALTRELEDDDIADILQQLPDRVIREVLQSMDQQDRQRIEQVLAYAEDTAGGLMNTDTITVRPNITLDVVLRFLRRHDEIPEMTDSLIVVNRRDEFIGLLPLRKLLVSDLGITVREIMDTEVEAIPATMPDRDVAKLFERNDWVSAPVVDEHGKLLGRITIDDVVDVIREQANHSLMSMAGLDEDEDTFAPILKTLPRRSIWLGLNLFTAFIASYVVGFFELTIEKVVALAVLMPIVASMGGVAGTQTQTVLIRGIAMGQVSRNNTSWLLNREMKLGLINGIVWATLIGAATIWRFNDYLLASVIAAAIIINLLTASIIGTLLPVMLKRVGIDPALAGGVLLTTFTDCVGFLAFLGIATLVFL
jgi:magnesium transporter